MEARRTDEVRKAERLLARPVSLPYWLITRHDHRQMEVLTIGRGGKEVLPVFSFDEEAREFLQSVEEEEWSARRTGAGELISVLYGPCAGVKRVALDPSSEIADLVSVSRQGFMDLLLGRGRSWFDESRSRERSHATSLNPA